MANNDGFKALADMLDGVHVTDKVAKSGLLDAANLFNDKLRPELPKDANAPFAQRYGLLTNDLKVVDKDDHVQSSFGDAFWWLFLEHGTAGHGGNPGIQARNYAHNTFAANKTAILKAMSKPVMAQLKKK